MTPTQQSALAALVGRALTEAEVAQIDALLPIRRDWSDATTPRANHPPQG